MEIGPILRAMTRNKLGVILIALQIAFTMTVMVNSVFIIQERQTLMTRPSGLDEPNLFYLSSIGFGEDFNEEVAIAEDLALLRQTPGIRNATFTNAIPVSGSGSSTSFRTHTDVTQPATGAAYYNVDHNALDTMGLALVAGENFAESDLLMKGDNDSRNSSKAIVSRALAEALFPGPAVDAVGQTFYHSGTNPAQIVGVVEQLQAPWPTSSLVERSALFPETQINGSTLYLVRTEPGQRDRLMAEVEESLVASNRNRIIRNLSSLEQTREESYRIDSAMTTILYVVVGTLVLITSMGIVGLAVFGINRRRKQIGTRRALGAAHGQILRYFMVENLLITGVGVLLGAALTIGFNMFLVESFNIARMDWFYTPIGMIVLLVVGQIAVFGPSTSASRVSPAIATRTI